MNILFIAPLPPPITGHSLVSEVLFDSLSKDQNASSVNLSKHSFKEGINGFSRFVEIARILKQISRKRKRADVVYFTISESMAGNLKDILIYLLLGRLLPKTYIHLHGGSIKRLLWDKHKSIYKINRSIIRKLAGVIISGKSHIPIFEGMIDAPKLYIVPNFASEHIFSNEAQIKKKFSNTTPLRILYMSNLIEKKGYWELAQAYINLSKEMRNEIEIDFAGAFDSEDEKEIFINEIRGYPSLKYHGRVTEEEKRELYFNSHVFSLPTSYFEGQPISILEAYASGCFVITTGQKGILDIFENNKNGFEIKDRSLNSVKSVLEKVLKNKNILLQTALHNHAQALLHYRESTYVSAITKIILNKESEDKIL